MFFNQCGTRTTSPVQISSKSIKKWSPKRVKLLGGMSAAATVLAKVGVGNLLFPKRQLVVENFG